MPERLVGAQFKLLSVAWVVAVALGLTGCFGWGPYEPEAPFSESPGLPYRLRATLADSQQVELTSPFVRADTLYGRSGPQRDTPTEPGRGLGSPQLMRIFRWAHGTNSGS